MAPRYAADPRQGARGRTWAARCLPNKAGGFTHRRRACALHCLRASTRGHSPSVAHVAGAAGAPARPDTRRVSAAALDALLCPAPDPACSIQPTRAPTPPAQPRPLPQFDRVGPRTQPVSPSPFPRACFQCCMWLASTARARHPPIKYSIAQHPPTRQTPRLPLFPPHLPARSTPPSAAPSSCPT